MTAKELRREIERALWALWPDFAARHPRLAILLDAGTVLDAVVEHFADDADCQHALADAVARKAPEQDVTRLIGELTRRWLRSLS